MSKKNKKTLGWIAGVFLVLGVILVPQQAKDLKDTGEHKTATAELSTEHKTASTQPAPTAEQAVTPTPSPESTDAPLSTEEPAVQTTPSAQVSISMADIPAYSGSPYTVINNNIPTFTETDLSTSSYEFYSELDSLGRCGVVYACIGRDLMPTQERGTIGQVKPSGWQTVKYDNVDGKYLYNRCHLIGYQLSGENANTRNLITGTRYLNVDGMLPFENMVADYVKETGNHVLYRVTPVFEGNNLLAGGVEMEAMSVEDRGAGILFHVYCYNVQPGIVIDYATGNSSIEQPVAQSAVQPAAPAVPEQNATGTDAAPVQVQQPQSTTDDNINITVHVTDTGGKYHNAGCQYLKKSDHTISLSDAKARGLEPCSRCNPPQ